MASQTGVPSPGASQASPWQVNQAVRNLIVHGSTVNGRRVGPAILRAYPLNQGVGNFVPGSTPQITINPQSTGLLVGFWVGVNLTVSNGSGTQINLTDLGPANALSQIQFNDLQNNTRIQCPGWLMAMINNTRSNPMSPQPFGGSFFRGTAGDWPINWSSNFAGQISAPASIAAGGSGNVIMWYWIPVAYSQTDLRGAIYLATLNAVCQLNLAFPGNGSLANNGVSVCVAQGADATQSIYVGVTPAASVSAVTITNANVYVSQVFYDQLPAGQNGAIALPQMDLSTIYEIKQTVQTAIVQNQDFPYQYTNYRDFLATYMIYVNTAAGGVRANGSDINYLELLTANFTAIWKKSAALVALETRNLLGTDMPPGCYYFPTRQRRISTNQYGNMQLIINPSVANTGAYQLIGTEDFALQTTISTAGSLPAS